MHSPQCSHWAVPVTTPLIATDMRYMRIILNLGAGAAIYREERFPLYAFIVVKGVIDILAILTTKTQIPPRQICSSK